MYEIIYHRFVAQKDFKKIPSDFRKKILKQIHKKLKYQPEVFGKPLQGDLKGYYRLRIESYRFVYRIEKNKVVVFILHVGARKDFMVYMESAKRLGLL